MVAARSLPSLPKADDPEQRMVIHGVPWKTYVLLRDAIDTPHLKMSYCEGVLELMSPSEAHERTKSFAARLLELYAFLTRTPLNAYGSTTFRREAKERGAEPDESYCVGRIMEEGKFPDIVIEVIETRPVLDKLFLYDGFEGPEVWIVENGKIAIHLRKPKGGYKAARRSALIPALDPRLIEDFAMRKDQDVAIHEFAACVQGKKAPRAKKRSAARR